jgi:hypothetical protein
MNAKQKIDETLGKTGADVTAGVAENFRVGTQVLLDEQANVLDSAQNLFVAWTKRRQEGIESAIRLTQKAGACKDFASVLGLYGEWMEESLGRVRADMSDACDEALHIAEIARRTTANLSPVGFGVAAWRSTEKPVVRAQAAAAKSADELSRRAAE